MGKKERFQLLFAHGLLSVLIFFVVLTSSASLLALEDAGTSDLLSGDAAREDIPQIVSKTLSHEVFSAANSLEQADSQQSELRQLQQLLSGHVDARNDFARFFSFQLSDPKQVRQGIQDLQQDLEQIKSMLLELKNKQQQLQKQLQQPERPAVIAHPPTAPEILNQAPPKAPKEIVLTGSRAKVRAAQKKQAELQADYKKALERFKAQQEQARKDYAQKMQLYQQALAAYQSQLAANAQQQQQGQNALAKKEKDLQLRGQKVEARLQYLNRILPVLESLKPSALHALQLLDAPQLALGDYAQALAQYAESLIALNKRLAILHSRIQAGALVGFVVEQERLLQQIQELMAGLKKNTESVVLLSQNLAKLAVEQQSLGQQSKKMILVSMAQKKPNLIDEAFLLHFQRVRQLRKRLAKRHLKETAQEIQDWTQKINSALALPERIGTLVDAERALQDLQSKQAPSLRLVAGQEADLARWQLAFERQLVAALEPFAADEIREQAYSLSAAYFDELQDEALEQLQRSQDWGKNWLDGFWAFLHFQDARASWLWLLRLLGLALSLVLYFPLRQRVPNLVTALVRILARLSWARGRMGQLVRWAGLLQAILPMMIFTALLYLDLAILGSDRDELRFIEVPLRWLMLYLFGHSILLGLTRRVSRGRPALLQIDEHLLALLRLTYSRLGLVLFLSLAAAELVSDWLSIGRLSHLIDLLLLFGLALWFVWASFAWRLVLGLALQAVAKNPEGFTVKMGRRISASAWYAFLSPLAAFWIFAQSIYYRVRRLFAKQGVSAILRARELKRMARKDDNDDDADADQIPEEYLKFFPLFPDAEQKDRLYIHRKDLADPIIKQWQNWCDRRGGSSVVVVGEKGAGKSSFVRGLMPQFSEMRPVYHRILHKKLSDHALAKRLCEVLSIPPQASCSALAARLLEGDDRVVILDDAHHTFLRSIDGFRAFDALVNLVNASAAKVFWIVVFNDFSWRFINTSRKREHYFRQLVELPRWTRGELQDMIGQRNKRSGFHVHFDEALLDEEWGNKGEFQLIEGAEGFFRFLWQTSRGNPRVATHLWLSALHPVDNKNLSVSLFKTPRSEVLNTIGDELLFALAAIAQHESLNADELCEALNTSRNFAEYALRFLLESGLLRTHPDAADRHSLAPKFYVQVISILRNKHLLFDAMRSA